MIKRTILLGLLLLYATGAAAEVTGTVCLGENLAKPYDEHSTRLYLQVDGSQPIYFTESYRTPKVVLKGLDVNKVHIVKVFFDGKQTRSWKLDFRKLSANAVVIWRAAGSWRMDEIEAERCE